MARAHTTKFLFDDGEYFAALTDADGVRIGIVGGTCFDIPKGHAFYDRIAESTTRYEVEGHFDDIADAYL